MSPLRLAFMGTPDFSARILQALIEAGHEVICVYSQPPRPAGRGKKDRPSPVHLLAEARAIEVRTPLSLKSETAQAEFAALDLDAAIVVAYGLILPTAILRARRLDVSTFTPLCCRAGAGRRRFSGRSWPATMRPVSR